MTQIINCSKPQCTGSELLTWKQIILLAGLMPADLMPD